MKAGPALLCLCLAVLSPCALAETGDSREEQPVIDPDVTPREIKEALIDTENWEAGIFFGVVSIEDFQTPQIFGLRLAYHMSERFFAEGSIGISEAGVTSFETLDNSELLTESERSYTYYNVSLGWNALPGEVFVSDDYAFNSNLYLLAGAGSLYFGGDSRFTVNLGLGYQVLLTDWLAVHFRAQERWYDSDLVGVDKTAHDFELSGAFGLFF